MWKTITYVLLNVVLVVYFVIVFEVAMDYVIPLGIFIDFDHYFIVSVLLAFGSICLTNAYLLKNNIYEKLVRVNN